MFMNDSTTFACIQHNYKSDIIRNHHAILTYYIYIRSQALNYFLYMLCTSDATNKYGVYQVYYIHIVCDFNWIYCF